MKDNDMSEEEIVRLANERFNCNELKLEDLDAVSGGRGLNAAEEKAIRYADENARLKYISILRETKDVNEADEYSRRYNKLRGEYYDIINSMPEGSPTYTIYSYLVENGW